ncbi:uncharacterized protein LOC127713875 [Mytilus californianus]|uniref:uncharacterized protein LOC127713875 n=1 Tax=Mytilus californianus TaxID=6549 RepID=UPI0022480089|nr:uncharacterized protein LOC127713875 [Mytilus californianus]
MYQCIDDKVQSDTQELIVIVGPTYISIENVTPDNRISGIEGHDMTIRCTATGGQPSHDIKLVILGYTYLGKQSAQHTFKPVRSNDSSNVTCLAGYEEINSYPLSTSSNIHLMLKPIITPFSPDTLRTEETKYFDVSCQSTGSRPAALISWLLGQEGTNVTSNSTSQSNQESSTDIYIL